MQRNAMQIYSVLLGFSLLVAFAAALWPAHASLIAASVKNAFVDGYIVAYFDQHSFADLLKAHCPHAECNVSLSIELMVRSAQDPGSSRVQRQLLSALEGPTQYSLQVPEDAQ